LLAEEAPGPVARASTPRAREKRQEAENAEPKSFYGRLWQWFVDRIIEPIATARRFTYLAILFLPVIFTSPILLLELSRQEPTRISKKRKAEDIHDELASTKWWYRLLVVQMERAGPTFIKVRRSLTVYLLIPWLSRAHS
jgi:aarF domain-containing kinase